MKYLLPIFFLLFFFQQTNAQVPGYQGKRLYISFELIPHFFIFDHHSNYDKKGLKIDSPVTVRFSNEGSINYVINRNSILSADFSFRRDRFSINRYVDSFFKTQNRIIGFGIKRMNFKHKGFIAPVGNFFQLRGFLINTKAEIYGEANAVTSVPTSLPKYYSDFGITLSWGLQTVWWDRLVPSYTVGLSYILTNRNLHILFDDYYIEEKTLTNRGLGGVLPGLLFTGKVGIGILLF